MAYSNKLGSLLLTTGNKSEVAVGYDKVDDKYTIDFSDTQLATEALSYRGRDDLHIVEARSVDQAFSLAGWQEYAQLAYGAERVEVTPGLSLAELEQVLESLAAINDVAVSGNGTADRPWHVAFLDAGRDSQGEHLTLTTEANVQRMTRALDVQTSLNAAQQWIPASSVVLNQKLNYAGTELFLDAADIDNSTDAVERANAQASLLQQKLRAEIPDLSRVSVSYDSARDALSQPEQSSFMTLQP